MSPVVSPVAKRRATKQGDDEESDEESDDEGMDGEDEPPQPAVIGIGEQGRCPHCRQLGQRCFDKFFGPYCLKTACLPFLRRQGVLFQGGLENVTAHDVTFRFETAFRHSLHFYVTCTTGEYDTVSYANIAIPACVRNGSHARALRAYANANSLLEVTDDMADGVIQSLMLVGNDNYLADGNVEI